MLWKNGKKKALTLSYDDGTVHDRRFIEMLNKYGIPCTFNLNSECFDENPITVEKGEAPTKEHCHRTIAATEVKELYKGHEVASHSCTHPNLCGMAYEDVKREIKVDIKKLEEISGQKGVIGFAYPYGAYDEELIGRLKEFGLVYARTVNSTGGFGIPEDFMAWHPTTHNESENLMEIANRFIETDEEGALFYLWGHSYEFYMGNSWDRIEEFLALMARHKDEIWFATNKEIYEYVKNQA